MEPNGALLHSQELPRAPNLSQINPFHTPDPIFCPILLLS